MHGAVQVCEFGRLQLGDQDCKANHRAFPQFLANLAFIDEDVLATNNPTSSTLERPTSGNFTWDQPSQNETPHDEMVTMQEPAYLEYNFGFVSLL